MQEVIEDIGHLIAGMSTVKDGRTLREVKPGEYEPKSCFGKLIDNAVNRAVRNAKFNRRMQLMETLASREDLVPCAQQEVERVFAENFGREKLTSNPRIDKIFRSSTISKMAYLAKTNGVPIEEVDSLIEQTVTNVLRKAKEEPQ